MSEQPASHRPGRGDPAGHPTLPELLRRQHGVLTRQQAYAAGLTKAQLEHRVQTGRWRRLPAGRVFAVFTGPPTRPALLWASLLRAGRGAVLSHHTAAELQGLVDDPWPDVHVTVPGNRRVHRLPGVVLHLRTGIGAARHPSRLPPQTRVEETVLDLTQQAGTLDEAIGWLTRAVGRRLSTAERIGAAMDRRAKLRWRAELGAALADVADGCHSPLELHYLRDVERAHHLPTGHRQAARARQGGHWYDDVYYLGYRTRVELDGRVAHPADRRWRDAHRDNAAAVLGDTTLRYGWADVVEAPCGVAAQVGAVLRRNGWAGPPRPCGPACTAASIP
ncbi:type IV toxin-antitoxin system AbiEi family antitoxin domain-containing protein [Plantactinospora sp. B5E13]|uniref:type IV toxin-antitoxin system AbiEi family antitoxin domain-containing protein n=1 Tax=unclassified Plantactinospora TaxID=2631981 RepID=UPI00325C84CB